MIQKIKRLLQIKRNCIVGKKTVLHETSRIFNFRGNIDSIEIGAFTHIKGEILTFAHGGMIKIGDYCYIGEQCRIWSAISIAIGDRVLISHNVNIFDSLTHPINPRKRHEQYKAIITSGHPKEIDLSEEPVVIFNDVWVGANSIILKGVTIGEGAVVGAGSVVTKDIRPWTIVAGNPAQLIREIPEEER